MTSSPSATISALETGSGNAPRTNISGVGCCKPHTWIKRRGCCLRTEVLARNALSKNKPILSIYF